MRRNRSAAQRLSLIIHQVLPYEQQRGMGTSFTTHAVKIRKLEAIFEYF
jgi:hypothetical protein